MLGFVGYGKTFCFVVSSVGSHSGGLSIGNDS